MCDRLCNIIRVGYITAEHLNYRGFIRDVLRPLQSRQQQLEQLAHLRDAYSATMPHGQPVPEHLQDEHWFNNHFIIEGVIRSCMCRVCRFAAEHLYILADEFA